MPDTMLHDYSFCVSDSKYYGFFGNLRHRELGHHMADKFRGLPAHIDAAFQNSNEQTVFFSGGLFYLFDDCNKTVSMIIFLSFILTDINSS